MRRRVLALLAAALFACAPAHAGSNHGRLIHRAPAAVTATLKDYALDGSSSTALNVDLSQKTLATMIAAGMPGSTKTYLVSAANAALPWKSESSGGATDTSVYAQVAASSDLTATRIIQTDLNTTFTVIGSPEQRRNWLGRQADTGKASCTNSCVLDLLTGTAFSGGRYFAWSGTDVGWGNITQWKQYRMARLMWELYPGHFVGMHRYWMQAPTATAMDAFDIQAGNILHTRSVGDYSHPNYRGAEYMAGSVMLPFVKSVEGGLPYCAYHRYFSNASTAQTLGGAVTSLRCIGSTTGMHFQMLNLSGAVSTDFLAGTPSLSGGDVTVPITRASATALKNGYYDQIVHVWSDANEHAYYRIGLGIGSLNKCNCDEMQVGPDVWATLDSVDNAGTLAAPSYTLTTSRTFRGLGFSTAAQHEYSFAVRLLPDALYDGQTMNIYFSSIGVQISRQAGGGIQVITKDDSNTADSSVSSSSSSCSVGKVVNSCGRVIVVFSMSDTTLQSRRRLMVINADTLQVVYNSGSVAVTKASVALSPINNQSNPIFLFTGSATNPYPASGVSSAGYSGLVARFVQYNKEIDWTVGISGTDCTACTNLLNLYTLNHGLPDWGVAAGNIAGDGRTTTFTAGAAGSFSGALAPFSGLSGNAADFHQGLDIGTGSGLGGEEPGNSALVGGQTWETWDRRDWRRVPASPLKGLAVTQ